MDTTICPWCDSEIVWDPEFGPEELCPHCHNELNGYRTLNIALDEDEDEEYVEGGQKPPAEVRRAPVAPAAQPEEEQQSFASRATSLLNDAELFTQPSLSSLKTIEQYGDENFNMVQYEENVEQLLDQQEEIPQCPHCQEYMLLAGTQEMGGAGFTPLPATANNVAILPSTFKVNVYVCPSCFHVHQSLCEDERVAIIDKITNLNEQ